MNSYQEQRQQFNAEQQQYWQALAEELMQLRDKGGASMEEIAHGLGISKQPLYNFIKSPKKGLTKVHRASLLGLWAYLTDSSQYSERKLSKDEEEYRQFLWHHGPDDLLRAAGYLSTSDVDEKAVNVTDPLMKRVMLRLGSQWLYDDALRAYVVDSFLDSLLDQGRPDRNYYIELLDYEDGQDRKKIINWPTQFKIYTNQKYLNANAIKSYQSSIEHLVAAGKTKFVVSELFELYQSILEHQETNNEVDEVKVYDCEFRTLSSGSILDNFISHDLDQFKYQAERRVSFNPDKLVTGNPIPPITEVKIRCEFIVQDMGHSSKTSFFQYSSTATHVENMLVAIKVGLCHPLDISGFFIRAVGRSDKSLARVSVALSEPNSRSSDKKSGPVFQGWWVSSNTIIGILKAFVDAFKRWLSKNAIRSQDYYRACQDLSEINQLFYQINALVHEGNFDPIQRNHDIEKSLGEIVKISNAIEKDREYSPYDHKIRIKAKERRSQLILFHLAIFSGNIRQAKEIFENSKSFRNLIGIDIAGPKNKHYRKNREFIKLLLISANSAFIKYMLMSGDKTFIVGKIWREKNEFSVANFERISQDYIKSTGNINFNCYSCASDFFSSLGIIEFYAGDGARDLLRKGYVNLLEAAHYSSRIGFERQACQWLMYAARFLCRIREVRTHKVINALIKHVEGTLEKNQSSKDKDWLNSIYHLTYGENLLFMDEKPIEAFLEFFRALKCSILIGYVRLIPDCLYNLSRACKFIIENQNGEKILGESIERKINKEKFIEWSSISNDYKATLVDLYNLISSDKLDFEKIKELCKTESANIWNKWAKDAGSALPHPLAEEIEKGTFLQVLDKT